MTTYQQRSLFWVPREVVRHRLDCTSKNIIKWSNFRLYSTIRMSEACDSHSWFSPANWWSGVDFTSFCKQRSQKHKKTVKLFCAFGIFACESCSSIVGDLVYLLLFKRATITSLCLQRTMTQQQARLTKWDHF